MADIRPYDGFGGIARPSSFGMSDFFRTIFGDPLEGTFRVDVHDEGDHYEVDAELPGLHREMINVEAHDGILMISADMDQETSTKKDDYVIRERRTGTVRRSFTIGDVKEDDITATYKDGVLKVILPKGQDNDTKARKIQID